MATFTAKHSTRMSVSSQRSRLTAGSARPARCVVVVRAAQSEQLTTGRRHVVSLGSAALLASLAGVAPPAKAFLGFGDSKADEEAYQAATGGILEQINTAIALDRDAPDHDEKVKELRNNINTWVARYRRDNKFSGRPSYANTYSVCNALAGHYNSFGASAPIPKKRLDRLTKELSDAQLLLTRGR